ncbi:MAG: hypothetical protein HOW73_48435 [Polyangiaceae bacterium]|nr:hypothetical protein [Polyangiaceae bacterium]
MRLRRALQRTALALMFWAGAVTTSGVALADARDEARALATEGIDLLREGKPAEALAQLRAAEKLHHAPTHLLFIARAQRALGRLEEAHEAYVSILLERLPPDAHEAFRAARREAAEEETAIRKEIATITIEPPDSNDEMALVDGRALDRTRLSYPIGVSEGAHTVEVKAGDSVRSVVHVQAKRGETVPVVFPRVPKERTAAVVSPWPWVIAAVGASGLIAGGATGGVALSTRDDAEAAPSQREGADLAASADTLASASTGLFIVGGLLLAGGAAWGIVDVATLGSDDDRGKATLVVGPGTLGVRLTHGWL